LARGSTGLAEGTRRFQSPEEDVIIKHPALRAEGRQDVAKFDGGAPGDHRQSAPDPRIAEREDIEPP
jgi:hypothetical protein